MHTNGPFTIPSREADDSFKLLNIILISYFSNKKNVANSIPKSNIQ